MNNASSIAAFRSKRLEQFRGNLEKSIKEALDEASLSSSTFITSYNGKLLTEKFSESVGWPELSRHHNKFYSGTNVVGSTPLQELCDILVESLPHACTAVTIDVLLSAIFKTATEIDDPTTTQLLPSQALLLEKIIQVMNSCPSSPCKLVFRKVLEGSNLKCLELDLLVSIVYRLALDCRRVRNDMVEVMLQVIQILDNMLKRSIVQRNNSAAGGPVGKHPVVQRRVKRQRYALSDLHDEDLSQANTVYFSSARFPVTQSAVSMKKVLQAKDSRESTADTFDDEAHNLTVRALTRAYKKVVKICASHHHPISVFANTVHKHHGKNRLPSLQMCGWVKIIKLQPMCPSVRLSLLLSISLHQPAELATLFWQTFQSSKDYIWLRFFSELIVSARYFDNPPHCWRATQPLWEHLEATVDDPDPGALAAWAHLLTTRGPLWQYLYSEEFTRRNTICSIHYGDAEHWRLALPQFSMTLQKYAILGLMELSRWEGDSKVEHADADERRKSEDGFQEWPFQETDTIIGAWSRLTEGSTLGGQGVLPPEFQNSFSSPTHFKDLLISATNLKHENAQQEAESAAVPPLLEHLNTDIQCGVFSYLDHLDMLRVRAVCKFWQKIIDDDKAELWKNAYKHRFGPYQLEEPLTDNGNAHWFSLFRSKHLMDLPLRFKRNPKTAYKHHTCNYVGCTFVVKSEKQQSQHEQSHIRRIARRNEMKEKEREREMKRKLREEEKEQREQERLFVQYLKEEAKREHKEC